MQGRPLGCGQSPSDTRTQFTPGHSTSQTTVPPVARSIAGHLSAGTGRPFNQFQTSCCLAPIARANFAWPPQESTAIRIASLMAELNAMFNEASTAAFNTPRVRRLKLRRMPIHASTARLYEAAKVLMGVTGQSAVASLLNESPQTVKNWEERGVSATGAITAEIAIGCRAGWIREGAGEMTWPNTVPRGRPSSADATVPSAIELLGSLLVSVDPMARAALAPLLTQLAQEPQRAEQIAALAEGLVQADASKRRAA